MPAVLQRSLLSLTMIAWGGLLLYFFASDRIAKYLAPDFRPLVLAGGLGLVVIGLFNLLTCRELAACGHDHAPGEPHDHDHDGPNPLTAILIMIVPVAFSVAWTRDAFSLDTVMRKGLQDAPSEAGSSFLANSLPPLTKEIIEQQHPADENGFRTFGLMELFYASADTEIRQLIDGMPVAVEGRLVPDGDSPPTQQRLYRLFITCCAADSRPIPIIARFREEAVPPLEPNTWVRLSGVITYPDEGRGPEPVLKVDFAEVTEPPLEESFMRGF
jgi:uncharacterized repeat protein (TIGR03943 family)